MSLLIRYDVQIGLYKNPAEAKSSLRYHKPCRSLWLSLKARLLFHFNTLVHTEYLWDFTSEPLLQNENICEVEAQKDLLWLVH